MGAAVRRRQPGAARGRAVVSAWRGWLTRMRRGVRRDRFEAEMADELRTHLELEAEARQARGAAPDAARREAAIAFGHVESLKESVRDRRAGQWLAQTAQDVRYAVRLLAKWPTFSAVVIGTIALAVCGTATIFSAFDAALLRPLPYPAPDRLVADRRAPRRRLAQLRLGRRLPRLARQHDAPGQRRAHGRGDGQPAPRPRRGRSARRRPRCRTSCCASSACRRFSAAASDRTTTSAGGANDVVLLTESLWRSRFGADAAIVGTSITLDERPRTVIGVVPDGIYIEPRRAVLRAGGARPGRSRPEGRATGRWCSARMTPGTTVAQLDAELKAVKRRLNPAYPSFKRDWGVEGHRPAGGDGARGPAAADRAGRRRDAGAADRVREHRQPAPGARLAARARGGAACRPRRRQRETGPPAADRERRAGPHRRRRRPGSRRRSPSACSKRRPSTSCRRRCCRGSTCASPGSPCSCRC